MKFNDLAIAGPTTDDVLCASSPDLQQLTAYSGLLRSVPPGGWGGMAGQMVIFTPCPYLENFHPSITLIRGY
eukprot:scaffold1327_cov65-Cyclotella_meneghiniana.AAC.2